ncbi:MAG: hypothetical protein KA778_05335 [Burkholderiaceae bacterium]|nr:hypothetical protein [Burkholderiaceae bacterium]
MFITDARHFLDDRGAIASLRSAAKAMAEFHAATIACATDPTGSGLNLPACLKCRMAPIRAGFAADEAIV